MTHNAEKAACPRCGHDTPGDPSRKPNGDHLVIEEGPLTMGHQPELATNSVRFTASQDVRLVWCSARVIPPAEGNPHG